MVFVRQKIDLVSERQSQMRYRHGLKKKGTGKRQRRANFNPQNRSYRHSCVTDVLVHSEEEAKKVYFWVSCLTNIDNIEEETVRDNKTQHDPRVETTPREIPWLDRAFTWRWRGARRVALCSERVQKCDTSLTLKCMQVYMVPRKNLTVLCLNVSKDGFFLNFFIGFLMKCDRVNHLLTENRLLMTLIIIIEWYK